MRLWFRLCCVCSWGTFKEMDGMTKAELVEEVTALGDLTRRDSDVIVETIFGAMIDALRDDDKIEIRGFGSFRTRQRRSRVGRNPKTGDRVEVPAKRVPFFKPSKELRDAVNKAHDEHVQSARAATESLVSY